jgi:hypothetical protein
MVEPAQSKLVPVLQTALALPIALVVWFLAVLISGVLLSLYTGTPLIPEPGISQAFYLSAAAWIGVYVAHQACELLFSNYARRWIFVMFLGIAVFNFAWEFIDDTTLWDKISRFAQGSVTVLAASAFFWDRERGNSRV